MQRTDRRSTWAQAGMITLGFVALLWVLEIVDAVSHHALDDYGVRPRSEDGLVGILFAPLLHGGWAHLEGNTLPVLVLGFLVLLGDVARGLAATAVIWLVSGIGVWLVSPPNTVTLGASVLVFGWLVYLIVRGVFTRRSSEIATGVVLLVFFGGLLLGVLPGQPGVSWQGHLFGAIGGGLAAAWVSRRPGRRYADLR
jgi:membrane associated rhomboid family serine protease